MEVIGVIDIRGGRAVHAVAGRREAYAPVTVAAGVRIDGDAPTLARAYVEGLGIRELYVADLDAIVDGQPPASALTGIAGTAPMWVDGGVRTPNAARDLLARGASGVIVALETLPSWSALGEIVEAVGGGRVAFSVDLRHGTPMRAAGADIADEPPERMAARAADRGAASVLVIDLARVGVGAGVDLDVLLRVRAAVPGVRLAAGGGVRGAADLQALESTGCDAALVASALHDGRVTATDVAMRRAGPTDVAMRRGPSRSA